MRFGPREAQWHGDRAARHYTAVTSEHTYTTYGAIEALNAVPLVAIACRLNSGSKVLRLDKGVMPPDSINCAYGLSQKMPRTPHGNDPDYILSSVRKAMDGFLLEYLRENERYCEDESLVPVTAIYTTDEVKHLLELIEMYHEYEIEKLKLDVISTLATVATLAHWSPPKLASGQQHEARIQELERIRDERYEEVMRDLFKAMMFHGLYDDHQAEKQMEMVRKVQELIEKQEERTTIVLIALHFGISDLIVQNMTEEERKTHVENLMKKYNETKGEEIDAE